MANTPIPVAATLPIDPFWGSDLQIVNGDLVAASDGDLAFVANAQNLQQALQNRLATEVGFLMEDPSYGIDLYSTIGRKSSSQTVALLESITENTLLQDPRVSSINNIQVNATTPGSYQIFAQISVYGFPYPLNVNQVVPFNIPQQPTISTVNLEPEVSLNTTTIVTQYSIAQVIQVLLSTDIVANAIGDFYTSAGSFSGNVITLGRQLPANTSSVVVTYLTSDTVRPGDLFQEIDFEPEPEIAIVINDQATNVLAQPTTQILFSSGTNTYNMPVGLIPNIIQIVGLLNGRVYTFIQGSPANGDYYFSYDNPNATQIIWNTAANSNGLINNPDNGTLFSVNYNYVAPIVNGSSVSTLFPIKTVIGVFTSVNELSYNYYYSSSGSPGSIINGTKIFLGTPLPAGTTKVYVSYIRLISGAI